MDIQILKQAVDGLLEVTVSLYEFTDGKGKTVTATVWVPDQDSRSAIEQAARAGAIVQLERALSALQTEYPESVSP